MRPPKFDVEGHTHFVTTSVWKRQPLFVSRALAQIVIDNLNYYATALDYDLVGYVIMPDHVHALIHPNTPTPITTIVQRVKRHSAKQIIAHMEQGLPLDLIEFPATLASLRSERAVCLQQEFPTLETFLVRRPRAENHRYRIWQESFYDFNVFSQEKLNEKIMYMLNNPVTWGLVEAPASYPPSHYEEWHAYE